MKTLSIGKLALVLGISVFPLMSTIVSAQTKQFRNWIVGCDNTHVCTAIAFAEPSTVAAEPGVPFLQIRHHPHRDATPVIRVFDPGPAAEGDRLSKSSARLIVSPTGAEIAKGSASYIADFEGNSGFRFRSARARTILHALRSSSERITISIGEKQNLRVNTVGLDEALAYMDVQQGLADTPGALVKKPDGDLTDYLHPAPPDIETVEGAAFGEAFDSGIPRKIFPPVPGCKPVTMEGTAQGYPLRGSTILLRNECADEAHNRLSAWYMLPGFNLRTVPYTFSTTMDGKRPDGALLANVEVLPNGGVIRAIRFRAPTQDCGFRERWGWSKGGAFELIERREMPLCRTAGPAHWIVTYRANFISPD